MVALPGYQVQGTDAPAQQKGLDDIHHRFLQIKTTPRIEMSLGGGIEIHIFDVEMQQIRARVGQRAGNVQITLQEPIQLGGRAQLTPMEKTGVAVGQIHSGRLIQRLATHEFNEPLAHGSVGIQRFHGLPSLSDRMKIVKHRSFISGKRISRRRRFCLFPPSIFGSLGS